MKSLLAVVILIVLVFPALANAQGPAEKRLPYAEIFVGYSYLNADVYGLSSSRQDANGWKVALSTPLKSYFALDYEVAGNYHDMDAPGTVFGLSEVVDIDIREYTIFFGPRVSYGPVFAHAMIGGDCLIGNAIGRSKSEWSLAGALGGGVQIPATKLLSFRVSADYEIAKHDIFGRPAERAGSYVYYSERTQNNFRVAAGVVFRLGTR